MNNDVLYADMRASFEQAGFVDPIARYTVESGEPYSAITRLGQSEEPYVILAHQDVLCDQGHTAADLQARLEELTTLDPLWAVAGNAGGVDRHRIVLHLTGVWCAGSLPCKVATLDENLLVLRTERTPRCSSDLSGFHLYGADVCLNARRDGSKSYVIDFRVRHLSPGNMDGLGDAKVVFARAWGRRMRPRYLRMTWGVFAIAKPDLLRRLMNWSPLLRRAAARRPNY